MRMSGLLLVPLAMVAIVSSAQARPSAPVTLADDVRELGTAIEQIHPAPFRSVSRQRFQAEVTRSPSARRASRANELLVGLMRIIALLGPRNGHTGLFPGDPAHTRELHFYPLRLYDFADGMYVVDAVDRSLVRNTARRDRGHADRAGPRARASRSSRTTTLEPARARAALPAHRRGARRARRRRRDRGRPQFTFERPDGQRVDVSLAAVPASRYVSTFADPLLRPLPVDPPARPRSPLYLSGSAQADVGAHARGRARGLRGATTPCARRRPAFLRYARAARARAEGAPRHRRRAAERRRRQHDVRLADRPPRARGR